MGMFRSKSPVVEIPPASRQATSQAATAGSTSDGILEQRLREAVAGARFHLNYQPLVSVADGSLVGLEALLRWDSDAGRISPATFIPVLESTELMKDVGPWVLAEACRNARPWVEAQPALLLAVNVSPQQLEAGFADSVFRILAETGFEAERLCLELVQPALIADATGAWSELRRLKTAGVRIFVDDFGALGSSIADLRRFAVDAVKIDQTFVAGLGLSAEDDAVVGAIITLANALGMRTIAEGVENQLQLERLRELGCDLAQGFHLVEPASPGRISSLVEGRVLAPAA
jgi:EAL domain-containing protein (putative c-di-GMP-specific phosphodiesterase class I)